MRENQTEETRAGAGQNRTEQRLEARVKAQNRANAEANRLRPLLIEALRPFVGKKVLTDSGLMKTVKAALPEIDSTPSLRVWREPSAYSFHWQVSANEQDGAHTCCYAEAGVWVGVIEGKDLSKVVEAQEPLRTDYTASEVQGLRHDLESAEKAMRDAQGALSPFPRYDQ